ncbi:MAG TPA: hypothetical protein VI033_08465 [Candidatus Nitrosopolaris sp.]
MNNNIVLGHSAEHYQPLTVEVKDEKDDDDDDDANEYDSTIEVLRLATYSNNESSVVLCLLTVSQLM